MGKVEQEVGEKREGLETRAVENGKREAGAVGKKKQAIQKEEQAMEQEEQALEKEEQTVGKKN
jgi:hypothetical protein